MDEAKGKQVVSDLEGESYEEDQEEKMKRSPLGSCKVEAESMVYEDVAVNYSATTIRVCNICGKTFSNGKALGGHRRSHFHASKKCPKKVKARFSNYSKSGENDNNRANCNYCYVDDDPSVCDGKPTCVLCNKEFPSKNALFGHMRSHPERPWRGIFPPTHFHKHVCSSSSSSLNSDSMEKKKEDQDYDDDDDDGARVGDVLAPHEHQVSVVDLSKLTSPSWAKRDKRGRKSTGGYEAAETLSYISEYGKGFCGKFSWNDILKKVKVEPKTPQVPLKGKRRMMGESSTAEKQVVKKIKFYLRGELKVEEKTSGGDDRDELNRGKGLSESGLGRIVVNMDDDDDDQGVNEAFNNLNTEVITTERLRDHVNFDEMKMKKMEKGKNGEKLIFIKSKAKDSEKENESQEKLGGYKCGTCGKSFSTFQGLGGHRSIHKEKNIVTHIDASKHSDTVAEENHSSNSSSMHKMDEASLNHEETTADEARQHTTKRELDIDLNEPYTMEE